MLRRRSIRLRILVLVLAPVVALVGLYAVVLDLTLGQYLTLRQSSSVRAAITQPVLKVQSALAGERQLALEYLITPHHPHRLRLLLAQESKTDVAVRQFGAAATGVLASGVDPKERAAIQALRSDLAGLGPLRTDVVGTGASLPQAASAYSSMVSDGDNVLIQAILPLVTNTAGLQAASVTALNASLQATTEESDVLKAEMTAHVFPATGQQLISQLATARQELWNQAMPSLDRVYQDYFNRLIPASATQALTAMERTIANPAKGQRAVSPTAWTTAEAAYTSGFGKAVLASENGLVAAATQDARTIFTRLLLAAGFGLIAIAIAIAVAVVVSRRLIRELDDLRLSALSLASEGLPGTIERLRAGEVVEAEAPTLLDSSTDEIGQVRLAFNTAARTAIAAAVEEIKIRRSVNDVFRNLARRNQSLLTRQLELLDAMERRVHDPDELADLFRIDHMTTRMRRHAEGLLIVAGSTSGRTWREPVPLIDVMRAATAEVENYTRVRVSSRTTAALAGHAVADVIHLLAELVENATIFSPASTPVRIDGDKVARGLALEIEDRGLGMPEAKLEEMNAKLADPPMFDLSVSDQLGLFIAGQLARRHDIKITLRGSPYGGITAVVLLPNSLVVDVDSDEQLGSVSIRELGGRPVPQLPGPASASARENAIDAVTPVAAQGAITAPSPVAAQGAIAAQATAPELTAPDTDVWPSPQPHQASLASQAWPQAPAVPEAPAWPSVQNGPATQNFTADSFTTDSFTTDSFTTDSFTAESLIADIVTADSFATDSFTANNFTASNFTAEHRTADGAPEDDDLAGLPVRRPGGTIGSWPANGKDAEAAPPNAAPANAAPAEAAHEFLADQPDVADLPVRVRQASLAPQLLAPTPDRGHNHHDASPEAARNIMAAMQRGWERGRAAVPGQETADDLTIPGQASEVVPATVRPIEGGQQ